MKKGSLAATLLLVFGVVFGVGLYHGVGASVPGNNSVVSYDYSKTSANKTGGNTHTTISADGNTVFWATSSQGLIEGLTTNGLNIYKRNLKTEATELVNVSSTGDYKMTGYGPGGSTFVSSSNGRYVAFHSAEPSVVTNPVITTNDRSHLYLRDTILDVTAIVDVNSSDVPANLPSGSGVRPISVSDDGRFVSFSAVANNLLATDNPASISDNSYIKDMHTGEVINPNVAPSGARALAGSSVNGASCDGSKYIMASRGVDLTPEDNGSINIYEVDIRNGFKITNLTHGANADLSLLDVSCNGRYILLLSDATNLTDDAVSGIIDYLYRFDTVTGEYQLINKSSTGYISNVRNSYGSDISDDGQVVFYSSDKNLVSPAATEHTELYIRNPDAGTTHIVPVDSMGNEVGLGNTTSVMRGLSISANGRYVTFKSGKPGLVTGLGSTSSTGTLFRAEID